MKTGDYFIKSNIPQNFSNATGKYSTQFMSGDFQNLARKKTLEESVRMGGYEVNVRKPKTDRIDMNQPMSRYSEFWIG